MGMPMFKGFMTNSAQENWNVVRIIYKIEDPMVKMVDKKWTFFSIGFNLSINTLGVIALALGSRPRQGLAKVQTKNEARESHFMLSGVWESVRE